MVCDIKFFEGLDSIYVEVDIYFEVIKFFFN